MLLMIDEGRSEMKTTVEELDLSGFQIEWKKDVDSGLDFFEHNFTRIDLLILDIMMPPGRAFKDEDTQDGLRTGFSFYRVVRSIAPRLPVIMFTNFPDIRFAGQYQAENCYVLRKIDYLPHELVAQIKRILAQH